MWRGQIFCYSSPIKEKKKILAITPTVVFLGTGFHRAEMESPSSSREFKFSTPEKKFLDN